MVVTETEMFYLLDMLHNKGGGVSSSTWVDGYSAASWGCERASEAGWDEAISTITTTTD